MYPKVFLVPVLISYTIGKKLAIIKIYRFHHYFRQKMMQSYEWIRNRDFSRFRRGLVRKARASAEVICATSSASNTPPGWPRISRFMPSFSAREMAPGRR